MAEDEWNILIFELKIDYSICGFSIKVIYEFLQKMNLENSKLFQISPTISSSDKGFKGPMWIIYVNRHISPAVPKSLFSPFYSFTINFLELFINMIPCVYTYVWSLHFPLKYNCFFFKGGVNAQNNKNRFCKIYLLDLSVIRFIC